MIQVRQYGGFTMFPLSATDPASVLDQAAELLDGRTWWISAGTALGLHRDGTFIPHDTDVDIEVAADWDNPPPDDLLPWRPIRTQHFQGRPMQLAYLHDRVIFDVYLFYDGVNHNEHGTFAIPDRFLHKLEDVQGWPAPSPIDDYLAWRYGPDWRTPTGQKRPWQDEAPCLIRRDDG